MANETAKSTTSKPSKGGARGVPSTSPQKPDSLLENPATPLSAEARRHMIAEAAFYLAERRGFAGGSDLEDWLLAERQVDAALSAEASPRAT